MSPRAYVELFQRTFGPAVAMRASLADDPDRAESMDREFLEFAERSNRATPGEAAELPYEYLLVLARKRES